MMRKDPTQEVSTILSHKEEDKLLKLDFHTHKEIALNDVSPDSITNPLKHIQHKNVKPETILYNYTDFLT